MPTDHHTTENVQHSAVKNTKRQRSKTKYATEPMNLTARKLSELPLHASKIWAALSQVLSSVALSSLVVTAPMRTRRRNFRMTAHRRGNTGNAALISRLPRALMASRSESSSNERDAVPGPGAQSTGAGNVLDGQKLLAVLEKFNFSKALRDSYEDGSNLDAATFLVDVTRCHWILNGKSFNTAEMTKVLEEQHNSGSIHGPLGITKLAGTNYNMWWTDFRKEYPGRYLALRTLSEALKRTEIKHPSLLLADEIVTHCHQNALAASLYFDIMLPFAAALNSSNCSVKNDGGFVFMKGEAFPVTPLFRELIRKVDIVKKNSFVITEELSCTIPVGSCTSTKRHTVVAALRYEMSEGKNGYIEFKNCSVKATITSPPDVKIKVKHNNWWTKLKHFFVQLLRKVIHCCLRGLKAFGIGTKLISVEQENSLFSVEKKQNNLGWTVLDFEYSIPPVDANPRDFLLTRLDKFRADSLNLPQSPENSANYAHENGGPSCTPSEEIASSVKLTDRKEAQNGMDTSASSVTSPVVETFTPSPTTMRA